jgi:hypothetical protein
MFPSTRRFTNQAHPDLTRALPVEPDSRPRTGVRKARRGRPELAHRTTGDVIRSGAAGRSTGFAADVHPRRSLGWMPSGWS